MLSRKNVTHFIRDPFRKTQFDIKKIAYFLILNLR